MEYPPPLSTPVPTDADADNRTGPAFDTAVAPSLSRAAFDQQRSVPRSIFHRRDAMRVHPAETSRLSNHHLPTSTIKQPWAVVASRAWSDICPDPTQNPGTSPLQVFEEEVHCTLPGGGWRPMSRKWTSLLEKLK